MTFLALPRVVAAYGVTPSSFRAHSLVLARVLLLSGRSFVVVMLVALVPVRPSWLLLGHVRVMMAMVLHISIVMLLVITVFLALAIKVFCTVRVVLSG